MINKLKKLIFKLLQQYYTNKVKNICASYENPLKVNGKCTVTNKTYLGKNVNFNGISIIGCGEVHIGSHFHSGTECMILTQNHNYEGDKIPYDDTYICKDVNIEDCVWIGSRVIILGGVTIGEGSIIQAGSTVTRNIPKYSIAGGHPAKVFSSRNKEHYNTLKELGKFH